MSFLDEVEPGDEPSDEAPIDWEAKGRGLKVDAMVAVEERRAREAGYHPIADAEVIARKLRGYTDEQWLDLQVAAGIGIKLPPHRRKVPSKVTQGLVIERFELRVDRAMEADRG